MKAHDFWRSMIAENRAGKPRGVASWCTAHPKTLRAILAAHRDDEAPILIEATCNQVNQHGGYTGMNPAAFRAFIERLAREAGIDASRLILGGDHLGPNPWKGRPAEEAMDEARAMVKAYVEAGFSKIHLDASMACADEAQVSEEIIAERAADLCAVAEAARGKAEIAYVVGTEVPIPGGELQALDALAVTRPEAARKTLALHREAFARRSVAAALEDVIALVVQPGVDMGNNQVFAYDKAKAASLSASIKEIPNVVFEAHSTDFQSEAALGDLVATHFAILKVGPNLTFAYREAIVAMEEIERRLVKGEPARVTAALEEAMDRSPAHWRPYIERGEREGVARMFGLSDRVRYYWPVADVEAAVRRLTKSIDAIALPPGLVSQFVGEMVAERADIPLSQRIVTAKVGAVVARYRRAAGLQ